MCSSDLRIAISFHLDVLTREEVSHYIEHRCKIAGADKPLFSEEAVDVIAESSGGAPRRINTYCELALMQGMLFKKEIIDKEIATSAIEDINI